MKLKSREHRAHKKIRLVVSYSFCSTAILKELLFIPSNNPFFPMLSLPQLKKTKTRTKTKKKKTHKENQSFKQLIFWFLNSSSPTEASTSRDWSASTLTIQGMQLKPLAQRSRNAAQSTAYPKTFYFMLQPLFQQVRCPKPAQPLLRSITFSEPAEVQKALPTTYKASLFLVHTRSIDSIHSFSPPLFGCAVLMVKP